MIHIMIGKLFVRVCVFMSTERQELCATFSGASTLLEELHMFNRGHCNGLFEL